MSILAHLILVLPHPFRFEDASPPSSESNKKKTPFSARVRQQTFYRPLTSLSDSLAPMSRVYRGLTPQFKVFLNIAAMTLGGSIWAERRVGEYMDMLRRKRRAERRMGVEPTD